MASDRKEKKEESENVEIRCALRRLVLFLILSMYILMSQSFDPTCSLFFCFVTDALASFCS